MPAIDDGKVPWRREDGEFERGCPWPDLEEAVATLALYEDWKVGIHPVSLGLAPHVTTPYRQAMKVCASAIAERDAKLLEEIEKD